MPEPNNLTSHAAAELGRRSGESRRRKAEQRRLAEAVDLIASAAAEQRPPLDPEQRTRLLAILGGTK